jgi:Secretion system C-terminal sorting domain
MRQNSEFQLWQIASGLVNSTKRYGVSLPILLSFIFNIFKFFSQMKNIILLFLLTLCAYNQLCAQCPTSIEEPVTDGTRYDLTLSNISQCPAAMNTAISIGSNATGYLSGYCGDYGDPAGPIVLEVIHNSGALIVLANQTSGLTIIFNGNTCIYNAMGVLPIELLSFEGKAVEKSNLLTWRTASETQNKGFDIERSTDGSRFETIGFVAGHGTTTQAQRYTFEDKSPLWGFRGYYRLKQLDEDGRFEYSKTITITRKGENVVSVFPNPTEGILNISASDYEQAFVLVNSIGQVVLQGSQLEPSINVQALPSGFYYLKIGTQTMKVVKE